ncbi:MAG: threonine--tRNA ligase [Armatimonadota bacterium]|nr:threonine--tRNA ligase [Armatimonadota bacterium]
MIHVTFPDGSVKEYEDGIAPQQIAERIGSRLAAAALAALVDGQPWDLTRPLPGDCTLKTLTWSDPAGREVYRHSTTHLMAQAVQALYPEARLTVGPPLEDRFYYDIDMPPISEEEFAKIEAKMREFAEANYPITREEVSREEARALFERLNEPYKLELLQDIPPDEPVSLYRQGDWVDLCRGPHLPSTGRIKAFKLLSVAGAYWRGDASNKQLQRLYGTSYPTQKELDEHLERLEQAKQRDHRKLGRELGLFTFSNDVGPGLPLWLPKGAIVRDTLETFLKKEQQRRGYLPVVTPHIGRKKLYETSGHWDTYRDSIFPLMQGEDEFEQFVLKPMNCPHHIQIYKNEMRSYRDLPLRYAEFGSVYRYEQSGELNGLTRVRAFTVDDSHLFVAPEQLEEEFRKVVELILFVFGKLKLTEYSARVGLRDPEKFIGELDVWEKAESAIIKAARELGLKHTVEEGEAAFYGPKLDFIFRDVLGRQWQLGTVQVDYNLPERFGLEYIGPDGKPHRPVMIHRAPFGSLERFIGLLIEHYNGAFPLWLAPVQVAILPIADRHHDYVREVAATLEAAGFRVEVNLENEKVGQKIAVAETQKIPYMAVIGDREVEDRTVAWRAHGRRNLGTVPLAELVARLQAEVEQE